MKVNLEQRCVIKFYVKLGKTVSEVLSDLKKVYGEESIKKTQVYALFKRFKEGEEGVGEGERPGRPATVSTPDNIQKVSEIVELDKRQTIDDISAQSGISRTLVFRILHKNLNLRKIAAKWVPRVLTEDQMKARKTIATTLNNRYMQEPGFLEKIVTEDETWVYSFEPESKRRSSEWKKPGSPRPKKAKRTWSTKKVMLITFFDSKGLIHHEFLENGKTVNSDFYIDVLRRFREKLRKKRPEMWKSGDWILQHDGASSHVSAKTRDYMEKNKVNTLPHPPYSPDLAPCDFFLFPTLKKNLSGTKFDSVEEIREASAAALKQLPVGAFQQSFQELRQRWVKAMSSGGAYFEGDQV